MQQSFLIGLFALLLMLSAPIQADETDPSTYSVQARIGYFYPTNHLFREIYTKGGVAFEAEGSAALDTNFVGWLNGNYFTKNGHSLGIHRRTKIEILPLSAGLKYFFPICEDFLFYLGAGASYTFLRIHDHTDLKQRLHKRAWGAVGKVGVTYSFSNCCFGDLFADYYYTRITLLHSSRDIGGVRTGFGLGICF